MQETYKYRIKYILAVLLFLPLIVSFKCERNETRASDKDGQVTPADTNKIPAGLRNLLKAYPDFLERADANHLYWKDGTVMTYDDGREKTYEEKLDDPDLEDMMSQKYTAGGDWDEPPAENFEPGRIRYEPFFAKMYGASKSEVMNNLVTIVWTPSGERLQISAVNGVDKILKETAEDLLNLDRDFLKYVKKTAGTFNYRKIAKTNRMSTHSYGIAIDINTAYSDYWQWDNSMTYKNRIPIEIVEVFEKHGFIWGGKWYHYDTMHFEYRPELLN
ncbi:MAG: M15 family metallopeptidase [Bacteroidetes bacterium]|nr:M15 family metallopeptidase [Bacteroidota bacterium]